MAEIWNEAELKRPAFLTLEVPNATFVESLHHKFTKCLNNEQVEKARTEFAETAALLSRLTARRKNSFRRMMGFRNLLKLNSALARLLRVDIQRDLESFCEALPDTVFGKKAIATLPTRNCLEFLMIRLLTVYKIHERVHDCLQNAAEYFAELLRACNFLDINVLIMSVLAKIRSLNATLASKFVELYNILSSHRLLFPLKGKPFFIDLEVPLRLNFFEKVQLPVPEEVKNEVKLLQPILKKKNTKKSCDIGMEVERKQLKTCSKNERTFRIDELKTVKDVQSFLVTENKARLQQTDECITRHIQNQLWNGAQKIFARKIATGDQKALSFFRKFLTTNLKL